jgi:hypothetical protein
MSARGLSSVIEFPRDRVRPPSESRAEGAAEVVIFPGIRIERLAFDLAERLPAQRLGAPKPVRGGEFDFF